MITGELGGEGVRREVQKKEKKKISSDFQLDDSVIPTCVGSTVVWIDYNPFYQSNCFILVSVLLNGQVAPMGGRREGKDIQHCSTASPIQLNLVFHQFLLKEHRMCEGLFCQDAELSGFNQFTVGKGLCFFCCCFRNRN